MRSVKSEESAVECNKKSPAAIGIAYRSRAFFGSIRVLREQFLYYFVSNVT
jgi:hypothetical protein